MLDFLKKKMLLPLNYGGCNITWEEMDMVTQTKELSSDTYLSFSDEIKIRMNELQFSLSIEEFKEIEKWLRMGINHPYFIERGATTNWVLFINEEDAVAFKLKWM